MRDFVNNGAQWCDVVVYEYKGHGTRDEEEFDKTYEDRAEDAWESLLPAFQQQSPGGPAEGCPFAFYCHSAGTVPTCLIAARLRKELNLEPTVVFIVDQAPPNVPFLNAKGYSLMCKDTPSDLESSPEWMKIWCPDISRMKGKNKLGDEIYSRWSYGMRFLEDFYRKAEEGFHIYHCPIYVFVGITREMTQAAYKSGQMNKVAAEQWKEFLKISSVTREDFYKWKNWTTESCEFVDIVASHDSIWYHPEADLKLWQEFLRLSGVADVLREQK